MDSAKASLYDSARLLRKWQLMQNSLSTFGQVLAWVRDRLDQVERIMAQSPEARENLHAAHQAIDELLRYDEDLENDFIKAAESEYQALLNLIENRNTPITDESAAFAEQVMDELDEPVDRIDRSKDLLRRMREEG